MILFASTRSHGVVKATVATRLKTTQAAFGAFLSWFVGSGHAFSTTHGLVPRYMAGARILLGSFLLASSLSPPVSADEVVVFGQTATGEGRLGSLLRDSVNLPARAASDLSSDQLYEQLRADRDRLDALLRAQGYFEARTDVFVDGKLLALDDRGVGEQTETFAAWPEAAVSFSSELGPRYRIRSFHIVTESEPENVDSTLAAAAVRDVVGLPATAETFAAVEGDWRALLQNVGYAFASAVSRKVIPEESSHMVDIALNVELGPLVRFGPVRFIGLRQVKAEDLEQYVRFSPEERYQSARIDELRATLRLLPVFQTVRVELSPVPDERGFYPVTVTVVERPLQWMVLSWFDWIAVGVLGAAAVVFAALQLTWSGDGAVGPWRAKWLKGIAWAMLVASGILVLQRAVKLAIV